MTDNQKTKRPRAKPSAAHYVDNVKFYEAIKVYITKYREAEANDEPLPQISNYLGECISKISNRLSNSPNFAGYSFKDEMIADGIENCFLYLHKFNIDKYDNPFSYYTQVNYFAFIRRIQKEEKQQYIKHKSYVNASVNNELVHMSAEDRSHFGNHYTNAGMEKSDEIISKYEEKIRKKKEKLNEPK